MDVTEERILDRYLASFPNIPGWFVKESMVAWDFLLREQARSGMLGDFLEIGVYKGRSAVLGALYLRPENWCVLVDINPVPDAEAMIRTFRTERNLILQCHSTDARRNLSAHVGKCGWVHVDGDHKGISVAADLRLAADMIHEYGIICLDDFFSFRYPQLTAVVYRFLIENPEFQLFFAGNNKAYVCRSSAFAHYDAAIRNRFVPALAEHSVHAQLNRTAPTSDGGHFTTSWKEGERSIVGLDEDCDVIPL